ncbi:MAG: adenosylmethionine decarboxylase [Leptospira sp.]|jgi:S-adenosylmethionine decarboxylase|nr:adenosylmethionine decarboxylase [Leptospira sp.]
MDKERIKLSGFNNLTKVLSFNLYDFCISLSDEEKSQYVSYIHDKYNASKITEISREIVKKIEANILSISAQDYDPVGASAMILMSDVKGGGSPIPSTQVSMHLDKSHITVHTYPDAADPDGICSFRVDIDISTCGEIIPLDSINYLFEAFECDVVYIDYVVRGYTRLADGKKIYNDHHFNSILDFVHPDIKRNYTYLSDINMPQDNTWQTKMMIKELGPENYVLNPEDINHPDIPEKMKLLREEMKEVYHMIH